MRGAINEHARWTIASLVDRATRRLTSGAIFRRAAQSPAKSFLPLSLSDLGSLFSLSLFLSLSLFPEMNWSENESVNSFPGQKRKFRSTWSEFPENFIFRCSQTYGFGGKWFLKSFSPKTNAPLHLCFNLINLSYLLFFTSEFACRISCQRKFTIKKKKKTINTHLSSWFSYVSFCLFIYFYSQFLKSFVYGSIFYFNYCI